MLSLSIVLPAYNEEANVESAVVEVSTVAQQLGSDYEIIAGNLHVNDGSTDGTGEIAREMARCIPNFRLVSHYPNRGYGGSLKAGFAAAAKDLIAFIPADKQFVFSEVDRFLEQIAKADIVCGCSGAWHFCLNLVIPYGFVTGGLCVFCRTCKRSGFCKCQAPSSGQPEQLRQA